VHFDDCFANCETEPETFPPRIGLFERVKDSFDKLRFDAHAAVTDLDGDVLLVRPHGNHAVLRRELVKLRKTPRKLAASGRISDKVVSGAARVTTSLRCRSSMSLRTMSIAD
jgi:hypothetical protein